MSENLLTFSDLELLLIGITGVLFIIQILYYLITYSRPLRAATAKSTERVTADKDAQPVSVIVYAHGEPEDLRNNLPILLNQDYPDYEIIVVNDGSDANSEDVLKLFSNEYKNLYYTYVPVDTQYLSHKKLALTMGIKAARHDILLFTEADCRPIGPKWIKAMAGSYNPETDIILGFCAYRHTKGFLHKLIAYDNLTNGLQMISSALSHHPFTGNGRNLSYRKKLFFAHKGYARSLNLHAGADDLFINEVSNQDEQSRRFRNLERDKNLPRRHQTFLQRRFLNFLPNGNHRLSVLLDCGNRHFHRRAFRKLAALDIGRITLIPPLHSQSTRL